MFIFSCYVCFRIVYCKSLHDEKVWNRTLPIWYLVCLTSQSPAKASNFLCHPYSHLTTLTSWINGCGYCIYLNPILWIHVSTSLYLHISFMQSLEITRPLLTGYHRYFSGKNTVLWFVCLHASKFGLVCSIISIVYVCSFRYVTHVSYLFPLIWSLMLPENDFFSFCSETY